MKSNTVLTITTAVGNAALLAGLVFLIFELRQNSSIAKSQIRQERVSGLIDQFSGNARDGVLSDLYYDVFIDGQFDLLKGTNKAKLYQFEIARFIDWRTSTFSTVAGLSTTSHIDLAWREPQTDSPFGNF